MSVSVVFPEEILTAVREDRAQFTRQVMIYTLAGCRRESFTERPNKIK
jgi:hypothetical protein